MSEKHTPGPWKVNGNYVSGADGEGRAFIAHLVVNNDTIFNIGRAEANARLIAEAPAMLEELRALAEIIEHDCGCAPCEGSMAPAEHHLGRTLAILARIDGSSD